MKKKLDFVTTAAISTLTLGLGFFVSAASVLSVQTWLSPQKCSAYGDILLPIVALSLVPVGVGLTALALTHVARRVF